jgi:hypothetical protein
MYDPVWDLNQITLDPFEDNSQKSLKTIPCERQQAENHILWKTINCNPYPSYPAPCLTLGYIWKNPQPGLILVFFRPF